MQRRLRCGRRKSDVPRRETSVDRGTLDGCERVSVRRLLGTTSAGRPHGSAFRTNRELPCGTFWLSLPVRRGRSSGERCGVAGRSQPAVHGVRGSAGAVARYELPTVARTRLPTPRDSVVVFANCEAVCGKGRRLRNLVRRNARRTGWPCHSQRYPLADFC